MKKYERRQRVLTALKTLVGCIGWGGLGYLLMISEHFWLGWAMLTVSLCVGAYALDRLMEPKGRVM